MELTAGGILGRYELLVRIGRGGMASVWVARERTQRSERLVAIKAMLPELALRADFRSMFLDEGQIARSIQHANVVPIYEVAEDRGVLYMAMEWVEGESLRVLIQEAKRRRPIPPEIAVRIIADAAAGLHAAHELRGWDGELRGIVHCDVSPHNILVGIDGGVKLVDFGVASAVEHLRSASASERIGGKVGYMSPEQASAQRVDRRSDVFSLGVVLFELTTGERLFPGEQPARVLDQVRQCVIPRPSSLVPSYPAGLEGIVLRALERDPTRRFQTADELREALERHLVAERVLVSRASVAQLLRRVVGGRIEKRRQLIRAVLQSIDGELRLDAHPNLAEHARLTDHSMLSQVSLTGMTGLSGVNALPTAAPEPTRPSHSLAAAAQVLDRRVTPRSPTLLVAGGALLAVAASWLLLTRNVQQASSDAESLSVRQPSARAATAPPQPARPAELAKPEGPTPDASETGAISIDSLPVAPAKTRGPRSPSERVEPAATEPSAAASATGASAPTSPPPPSSADPEAEPEQPDQPEQVVPQGPLNRSAATVAMGKAAAIASYCKRDDGPSGTGQASVTLDPAGTVSSVSLSAPFEGTSSGACVVKTFRRIQVPPFTGSAVTVTRSFTIPE